jgi:hypothetical protein
VPIVAKNVRLAFESRDPDFSVTDEARILSGEGEIIWVEVRFRVKRDAQGNTTHLLGINQDITERKQAEEEIRSISRFPSENPNPVLRIQRNGTILYASQSAAPILTTWKRDVGQKVSNDWQKTIAVTFESGINKEVEIESDGRIFSCILTPIPAEEYVNIYGRDVTASKQVEEH